MRRAFTLIEMLVVIAVIALLIAILLPTLAAARKSGERLRELSALRSLGQAHTMYTSDNRDTLLPGLLASGSAGYTRDEWGTQVGGFPAERWAYRLGPYFGWKWAGATHVNDRAELLQRINSTVNQQGAFMWHYEVSIHPSFGMNSDYVGGNYASAFGRARIQSGDAVTRLAQARRPGGLIHFASARNKVGTQPEIAGFYRVNPPPPTSTYEDNAQSADFGHVHCRYGTRAVVLFLDGRATAASDTELTDRRLWVNTAQKQDDPDWRP